MIIAVNTRFLLPAYKEGYGNFIYEVFIRMAGKNPSHHFVFIYDRPQIFGSEWPSNVEHLVLPPPARHPLLWKWWYDYRLPALLQKIKADIFFSPDGFCSLRTRIPQFLVIHDLAFIHFPASVKQSHLFYYKKYTGQFIKRAKKIITVSDFSAKDILENYPAAKGKIETVYNGVRKLFLPLDEKSKVAVKNKYTGGKEYFFYAGSIHPRKNLINLLKAFSVFKKRLQSGMKLVISGRLAWKNEIFLEDLASYKYRDDVIMTGYMADEELAALMGTAYAFVYPSLYEGFGMPVLEAIRAAVPVITSKNSAMEEIAGDAALYADPADPSSIAENMMLIYKDENLRKQLIEKGKTRQQQFSWDKTADEIWELLQ